MHLINRIINNVQTTNLPKKEKKKPNILLNSYRIEQEAIYFDWKKLG